MRIPARFAMHMLSVAVVLAGTGALGVTSASAAAAHPDSSGLLYDCTAGQPEVCFGVEHTNNQVGEFQWNVKMPFHATDIVYEWTYDGLPGGWLYVDMGSGGPGWVGQEYEPVALDDEPAGQWCGQVTWDGGQSDNACVNVS
jgi:hypothetical protein